MDLELQDRVVCITGGSKGIGLETARSFAREGALVVICARRREALDEAVEDIARSTGRRVDAVIADVTRVEDIDALLAHISTTYGRLDILVNNAGTGTYKPFLEVTDEELVYGMAINFFAQFRVTQRAVPLMKKAGGGSVVNVSGRTATKTNFPPGSSCTGPAKAAEVRLSADLGVELAEYGIRVNCVIPGVVESPERFQKWEREALSGAVDDQNAVRVRRALEEHPVARRWGKPQELADVILFLASPRSSYVNGASLIVDGGSATKSYVTELYQKQDLIRDALTAGGGSPA
jgi:3-oxoacyl-[acyl-carrier protein] reductase